MIVYRIENDAGVGVYWGSQLRLDGITNKMRYDLFHKPSPLEDGMKDYHGLSFGFKDEKQLYAWFKPKILNIFRQHGYYVALYDIDQSLIIHGNTQIAFNKDDADYLEILEEIRAA